MSKRMMLVEYIIISDCLPPLPLYTLCCADMGYCFPSTV